MPTSPRSFRRLCAIAALLALFPLTPASAMTAAAPMPGSAETAPAGAATACAGRDLIAALPAEDRAALDRRVAAVPHARGIFWTASKGRAMIRIVGTYHFPDPRHAQTLARVQGALDSAAALLVEAGPEDEAALAQALKRDPALMTDPRGPALSDRLGPRDWQILSRALADRGIPPAVANRLRPWYVGMMLGISPCMIRQVGAGDGADGLDHLLIARATARGVPVRPLERWDTLFGLFDGMTPAEEDDMIRASLPAARNADDYAATTTEAYFRGDVWQIWEFGRIDAYRNSGLDRGAVDRQTDLAQAQLMEGRNRGWIAPLTDAAQQAAKSGKAVLAAFGALHLPGEGGVLRLLEKDGWTVKEWAP